MSSGLRCTVIPMADLRVTEVDLDGVLTLLGRHLYTTPAVAIR